MALHRSAAAAAALLALVACTDDFAVDPQDGFVARLETDSWPASGLLDRALTLRVSVVDSATGEQVSPQAIQWSVQPAGAADVLSATENLVVLRPLVIGEIQVTATLDDPAFAPASITAPLLVQLGGIAVPSTPDTLRSLGEPLTLHAVGLNANGDEADVEGWSWSVDGSAVAAVGSLTLDSLRLVAAANGAGTVTITHPLCAGACSATIPIAVEQAAVAIDLPAAVELHSIGGSTALPPALRDARGNALADAPEAVQWRSTNDAVATVGPTGVVTAIANGSASIIAQSGELADTTQVTVQQIVASITIAPVSADTLSVGDTLRLSAVARDSAGTTVPDAQIAWSSTEPLAAIVDQTGKVTALARGATAIRAFSNGALAEASITIASFALAFDGGDVVEIANGFGGPLNLDSAFTIELWVRPRSTAGGPLFGLWNENNKSGSSYALYLRGLVPRAYVRSATGNVVDSVNATIALTPDAWHHVAFTYSDGVGMIYVNGVLAGTAVGMARPQQQTSSPIRIGADMTCTAASTCFVGDIDEIRVWSRARGPAELLAEQVLRLPAGSTGLRAYYPLYLGTGDPVDLVGGLVGVRGDGLGAAALPGWIIDGSPAP